MIRYRVTFDRIGRRHDVPPLEGEAATADEIAEQVYRHAGRFLGSRFYTVDVDLETCRVSVEGGRFGTGIVVVLEEVAP